MRTDLQQCTLFDLHPIGTEPPVPLRPITPGCLLPFPNKMAVDVPRVMKILNLSKAQTLILLDKGLISRYRFTPSRPWLIDYDSLVEYCDWLRVKFAIRDRRPKLAPGRRWRDVDLLPFPLTDTVTVKAVEIGLECAKKVALRLIEEGAFEAYRLHEHSFWRVSKTSLFEFRDSKRADVAACGVRVQASRRRP